jgi:hypothetical protein
MQQKINHTSTSAKTEQANLNAWFYVLKLCEQYHKIFAGTASIKESQPITEALLTQLNAEFAGLFGRISPPSFIYFSNVAQRNIEAFGLSGSEISMRLIPIKGEDGSCKIDSSNILLKSYYVFEFYNPISRETKRTVPFCVITSIALNQAGTEYEYLPLKVHCEDLNLRSLVKFLIQPSSAMSRTDVLALAAGIRYSATIQSPVHSSSTVATAAASSSHCTSPSVPVRFQDESTATTTCQPHMHTASTTAAAAAVAIPLIESQFCSSFFHKAHEISIVDLAKRHKAQAEMVFTTTGIEHSVLARNLDQITRTKDAGTAGHTPGFSGIAKDIARNLYVNGKQPSKGIALNEGIVKTIIAAEAKKNRCNPDFVIACMEGYDQSLTSLEVSMVGFWPIGDSSSILLRQPTSIEHNIIIRKEQLCPVLRCENKGYKIAVLSDPSNLDSMKEYEFGSLRYEYNMLPEGQRQLISVKASNYLMESLLLGKISSDMIKNQPLWELMVGLAKEEEQILAKLTTLVQLIAREQDEIAKGDPSSQRRLRELHRDVEKFEKDIKKEYGNLYSKFKSLEKGLKILGLNESLTPKWIQEIEAHKRKFSAFEVLPWLLDLTGVSVTADGAIGHLTISSISPLHQPVLPRSPIPPSPLSPTVSGGIVATASSQTMAASGSATTTATASSQTTAQLQHVLPPALTQEAQTQAPRKDEKKGEEFCVDGGLRKSVEALIDLRERQQKQASEANRQPQDKKTGEKVEQDSKTATKT